MSFAGDLLPTVASVLHRRRRRAADAADVRCNLEPLERRALLSVVPTTVQFEDVASTVDVEFSRTHAGYTGRGYLDYVEDDGRVNVEVDGVAADSDYLLTIRYANGSRSARTLEVYSDTAPRVPVSFPPTGSWSTWSEITVRTRLQAGDDHYFGFRAIGQNGPNLDALTYGPDDTPPQPTYSRVLQAEAADDLSGAHVASDNPGYTSAGYIDFDANSGGRFTLITDELPFEDDFNLEIRYANGSNTSRPLMMASREGDFAPTRVDFAPTGSWSTSRTVTVPFRWARNNAGLIFTSVGFNGPNIDSATIRQIVDTPAFARVVQAEQGQGAGIHVASQHRGYTGIGYVDFDLTRGAYVDLATGSLPGAGEYELEFRYANGSATRRVMSVSTDTGAQRVEFAPTGSWSTWGTVRVPWRFITSGGVIRLETTGSEGPNLDSMTVRRVGS